MHRSTSARQLAAEPGSLARLARPWRLQSALFLLLGLLVYLWLAASRAMLVQHVHLTQTVVSRISIRASRSLREVEPWPVDLAQFKLCRRPRDGMVVPHLSPVQQWRSSRPREERSVTLVTQLSLERLEMLGNQCSVWPDPVAAVVYVPTVLGLVASADDPALNGSSLEEAASQLDSFHRRMDRDGACALELELVSQEFEGEGEAGLYPFNAARNRALQLARTEALLLLDADFIPSPSLVREYKSAEGYAELLQQLQRPTALVLPAFEIAASGTEGKELALAVARGGKAAAVREYLRGSLAGFQVQQYHKGHSPTNYALWTASDLPYTVEYQKGYEPYVLAARSFVPWYDERFRGYGRDKIQHLTHLAGLNVTFAVHPTAFVVHVPHAKAATFRATKESGQWDKLYDLYVSVRKAVRRHRFAPVVSFDTRLCAN